MTESRPERIARIFAMALERPLAERDALVERECGEDADLLREVRELLVRDPGTEDIADSRPSRLIPEPPSSPTTPERIGPYVLRERLGEGGFGEVFAAEQTEPVRRRVALKILKPGMDTRVVLARFEAERQALALMDHPCIAKVFDAGETDRHRPYFVMELIPGEPITAYCDRNRLSVEDRLALFTQVCSAVQHAHQKGVIHRDIKPSNVLVTSGDDGPVPKIIDFGIAKATAQSLTEETLQTRDGQLIGTPAYMSPEQAGGGLGHDVRTDVYSLGVLLYELLTGSLPLESAPGESVGITEMRRLILETEPTRPSQRIATVGDRVTVIAEARCTDPSRLGRRMRGELDWLTMRALEKSPAMRYQSASALADDVQRYLRGDAILAGPPSATYKLRKLVSRHRLSFAFATAVLVLVVGFGIAMAVLRHQADVARADAQSRADQLELVTSFQASMLRDLDLESMGSALFDSLRVQAREGLASAAMDATERDRAREEFDRTLRDMNATNVALTFVDSQILGRAAQAVAIEFGDQPLVRATLQQTIADTYRDLGLYEQAIPMEESVLEVRRGILGEDDPLTLASRNQMGVFLHESGRSAEALEVLGKVLTARERVLGPDHPETLESVNNLGLVHKSLGNMDDALSHYERALAARRRVLGDGDSETLGSMSNLGELLSLMGRFEEAIRYHEEALEGYRRVMGRDDAATLTALNNLATALTRAGRPDDSIGYFEEALERKRRLQGDDHFETLTAVNNLAFVLMNTGRNEEARPLFAEAVAGYRRSLGDQHPLTFITLNNLGRVLAKLGRREEALVRYAEAVPGFLATYGEEHQYTLGALINQARLWVDEGEPGRALESLVPREAAVRKTFPDGAYLARYLAVVGQARVSEGDYERAGASLREAEKLLDQGDDAALAEDREAVASALRELEGARGGSEEGRM